MYRVGDAPTDQRTRPISFVLLDRGLPRQSVTLPIRPEDLNRVEGSRATVHQTLGRGPSGWVDNFGEALPSCTISGHTGWRVAAGLNMDGWDSFEALNKLVQHEFHSAKQDAIDSGRDPAEVQLIFVDALDDFTWSVVPTQFVLRRSKSRPLLYQYQIALQAVSTDVEQPTSDAPTVGNRGMAAASLGAASETIASNIDGLLFPQALIPVPSRSILSDLVDLSNEIFNTVNDAINAANGVINGVTNDLLILARDMAQVGLNVFRTLTAAANLPLSMMARAARIAAAFNEVVCIFSNALAPRPVYEEYSGLYGASNCSSTTGGRPPSPYANLNVFNLMLPSGGAASITSSAMFSVSTIKNADPVLAPMPVPDLLRNADAIVKGVAL